MRTAVDHSEAILQTAARLFARKPFHEVLMEDVAEQTGIAKGTVYRYFPNKDELFAALSMRYLDMLAGELGAVAAAGTPPLERLHRMVQRLAELVRQHNDFFQVMQRHECGLWAQKHSEFLQRRTVMRDHFARVIEEAEKAGQVRSPFGSVVAADLLLGMTRSVLRFISPLPEPAKAADIVVQVLVHGLSGNSSAPARNGQGARPSPADGAPAVRRTSMRAKAAKAGGSRR